MLVRSWWLCLALFIGMPLLIFYQISIIYWMYALSAFYIVKLRAWTTQLSRMSVQIVLGCCEIWTLHNTYFKTNVDSIHKIWSMSSSFLFCSILALVRKRILHYCQAWSSSSHWGFCFVLLVSHSFSQLSVCNRQTMLFMVLGWFQFHLKWFILISRN